MRIFSSLLLCLAFQCSADNISGTVVGVTDGDTITLLDARGSSHKIRLAGIDAPEKAQAFGNQAKASLSELVFGREVTIDSSKRDKYGRIVGRVSVDGTDANLEQIKRGMAWHYKRYEFEQNPEERETYSDAEKGARAERHGLWLDSSPVPPWQFRRRD